MSSVLTDETSLDIIVCHMKRRSTESIDSSLLFWAANGVSSKILKLFFLFLEDGEQRFLLPLEFAA